MRIDKEYSQAVTQAKENLADLNEVEQTLSAGMFWNLWTEFLHRMK